MKESPRPHSRTPEGTATHTSVPRVITTRKVCFNSDIEGINDQVADRGIVGRTRSGKRHTAQPKSAHFLKTRIIPMYILEHRVRVCCITGSISNPLMPVCLDRRFKFAEGQSKDPSPTQGSALATAAQARHRCWIPRRPGNTVLTGPTRISPGPGCHGL
jgi:hypothetical protein